MISAKSIRWINRGANGRITMGIVKCWRNYPFTLGIMFKHFAYKTCTIGSMEFTRDTLRYWFVCLTVSVPVTLISVDICSCIITYFFLLLLLNVQTHEKSMVIISFTVLLFI